MYYELKHYYRVKLALIFARQSFLKESPKDDYEEYAKKVIDRAYFLILNKGGRFEALNSYTDNPYKQDEEIVLDEHLKIIIHYYSNPILAEILKEFSGYEGISFIEMKSEVLHISVCI